MQPNADMCVLMHITINNYSLNKPYAYIDIYY